MGKFAHLNQEAPVNCPMFPLPASAFKVASHESSIAQLSQVTMVCGHCAHLTIIPLGTLHRDRYACYLRGNCPHCNTQYDYYVKLYSEKKSVNQIVYLPAFAFVNPAPKMIRTPIVTREQMGDAKLHRAYMSALTTYDKGAIESVPVAVGRALEGIVKTYLTAQGIKVGKPMLAPLLTQLARDVDLSKPLKELTDAIRVGRNIGAHFDEDMDPSAEMAERMLDLLDVIVEYLYVLPAQIEELKTYIAKPVPAAESPTPAE